MALRPRAASTGVRDRYTAEIRHLAESYGHIPGCPWPDELARLEAGERVIVQGWEIDLGGNNMQRYAIEPDGGVTPLAE
jgi:hypothetical protein